MHFYGVFMQVHFEAKNKGLRGLTKEELPDLPKTLKANWPTLIPLVLLIGIIVQGNTPYLAAFSGISSCILVGFFTSRQNTTVAQYVALLVSHALLLDIGIGSALWSVSRGLARNSGEYKRLLMAADQPRRNDLDGRGALSHDALIDFCRFFLETCLDQIRYMRELLSPSELQRRMELYVRDEESAERLPKRSYAVLREALLSGELERGRVPALIDTSERTARRVISALIDRRLLISGSHKAPLRLGFPIDVVERWFPKLYPTT
jgi:hypothetical protein